MVDYSAMYKKLFQSQTEAIEILQKAQQDTEEMYISASGSPIKILDISKQKKQDLSEE